MRLWNDQKEHEKKTNNLKYLIELHLNVTVFNLYVSRSKVQT